MLFGVYLSAFIYNSAATFRYLEQAEIIEQVFMELFTIDAKMFHPYQRKLYIIGFGQSLFSDYVPTYIEENVLHILSKMILMLGRLNLAEKYKEKKDQASRQQDEEDGKRSKVKLDFLESMSDVEDEKVENELKEINDYYEKE